MTRAGKLIELEDVKKGEENENCMYLFQSNF